MRDDNKKPVSFIKTMQAGFASSVLTCGVRWVPDCIVNRKIVDSAVNGTGKSFLNIGIAWDLAYRIPANTFVFPAQYHFKEYALNQLDEKDRTQTKKIAINAGTGVMASLLEGIVFYPLDGMRTLAQTKPDVFAGRSMHYFLTHQSQLYRGLNIVLVRNTVTNIVGWSFKATADMSLEKTSMPCELQTMLASFVFSFSRIVMGYPFATIGVLIQADTDMRRGALTMINHRLKERGFQSFYQGFLLKGGSQILTTFLQMWLFSWYIHPERKAVNPATFFSSPFKMATVDELKCEVKNR